MKREKEKRNNELGQLQFERPGGRGIYIYIFCNPIINAFKIILTHQRTSDIVYFFAKSMDATVT